MTESCVHCGDSGILNVIATFRLDRAGEDWTNTSAAVSCHMCAMGAVMAEVGVDG